MILTHRMTAGRPDHEISRLSSSQHAQDQHLAIARIGSEFATTSSVLAPNRRLVADLAGAMQPTVPQDAHRIGPKAG